MAQYGEGLIASGNPTSILIGTFLMVPETGKDFGDLSLSLSERDFEKALMYGGALFITGTESVVLVNNYKQTKKLNLTPEKYYDIKNKVGLTPELAEVITGIMELIIQQLLV